MIHRIKFCPAALRAMRRIDRIDQRRIQGAIALLATSPRPPGVKALKGRPGYRVRIGDHRVLYTIQDDVLLIVVVAIGHRRDVHRR